MTTAAGEAKHCTHGSLLHKEVHPRINFRRIPNVPHAQTENYPQHYSPLGSIDFFTPTFGGLRITTLPGVLR